MSVLTFLSLYASKILRLYLYLLWIRIIVSYFNPYPRQGGILYYLTLIVDPFLDVFRRRFRRHGFFDYSVLLAFATVALASSLLYAFSLYGRLTLSLITAQTIVTIWQYIVSIYIIFLIIIEGVRFVMIHLLNNYNMLFLSFHSPVRVFYENKFGRKTYKDVPSDIIIILLTVFSYFALKYIFSFLLSLALRIPF